MGFSVLGKLFFSKHKQEELKKKWDCIMFVPTLTVPTDGRNKTSTRNHEENITNSVKYFYF